MEVLTCTSADPAPGEKLDKVRAKNPKKSAAAKAMWEARRNGGNWCGSGGSGGSGEKDSSKKSSSKNSRLRTYAEIAAAFAALTTILYLWTRKPVTPSRPRLSTPEPVKVPEPVKAPEVTNKRPHPT